VRSIASGLARTETTDTSTARIATACIGAVIAIALVVWIAIRARRRRPSPRGLEGEERFAWLCVAPAALLIASIALFPLVFTAWESLFSHDLRMPWRGRPFVGVGNYAELAGSARFWAALAHTGLFTVISVTVELVLGLALALVLHHIRRGRAAARALALVPWAIPTVVAALVWQFMFSDAGAVNAALIRSGIVDASPGWLVDSVLAWVPVIVADVWKTTPFVALLLLAGMQSIDPDLYDAARTDGARAWQSFWHVTLPLLRPALLLVVVFRTLDAVRVFDLIYVLTGGGPGTATEPVAVFAFSALMQHLRFGLGSAAAIAVFAMSCGLAAIIIRLLGADPTQERNE
jgi:ABC-type sugar transport system permease subunit